MAQPEFSPAEDLPQSWLDRQSPRLLRAYGAAILGIVTAAGLWAVEDYSFLGNGISAPQQPGVEQVVPNIPPTPEAIF